MCIRDSHATVKTPKRPSLNQSIGLSNAGHHVQNTKKVITIIRNNYLKNLPPREIAELIQFPNGEEYKFDEIKFYNKTLEQTEKIKSKYQRLQPRPVRYQVGDRILLKNRELPNTTEGIAKKLLLLYLSLIHI